MIKKNSKMKISLLGLKVAPVQTEDNKKPQRGVNEGNSEGNVEEGIALLFSAHEINVL